ncbi:2-keto-4-pentenoate hydratase/2-oxohepta-3-ene-1,7-dioic acid hydratase in catechol pathway [Aneurinibacillus soli]|uniref:Ureidoglycolate lyase n=1 Tax=Aneurinibacillus soli TaxID=1500254 RepID=A0A0U5B0P9_9BACL|nr:fumarylacetoacetate hydrolase family protein [Aneurinibacillus soli]PYE61347.1 2-keto-4-pentenoate hydratase/2-oxohepta-3-ene-1,7-dioic acid hydratase in catechol pathway [Aneurinibacillus soli]BAU27824.1 Ureidoglycolate lyase [Aneurinibacillus soli]
MKLLNFNQQDQIRLGIKTDHGIIDVGTTLNETLTMEQVIEQGDAGLARLRTLLEHPNLSYIDETEISYAPIVSKPEKIICVGLNYISHAEESNMQIPTSPVLFSKFANALAAHKEPIRLPRHSEKIDYEAELVIVIGKTAKDVSEADALHYVYGYSAGNDLSARDFQFRSSQWLLGKTCDQFAPVGPYLVTADEVGDAGNLRIQCTVNGEVRQSANTKDMIFSCAAIISYVSHHMTLQPGDIIYSGTPEGVILGYPEDKQKWLQPGDKVAVSIEKIGTLTNVLV